MSTGEHKRRILFDIYSANLDFLIRNKVISKISSNSQYICPICLGEFSKDDLSSTSVNPLTLEDSPPKSLGGSQIALTCASCNHKLGKDIDWHLSERLKELDFNEKITGAKQIGKFILGDISVNGEIQIHENQKTIGVNSKTNNNPINLQQYINEISNGRRTPVFKPKSSRVDPKKLQIALLKSAYIMMFAKFGYSFLFNHEYDRIRQQLRNPKEDIYPLKCWFYGPFPRERIGVPFITEKNLESIFVLFELKTKLSSRLFAVVLPLSSRPIEDIIKELEEKFSERKTFKVMMESYTDDYLRNIESVNLLINWMNKFKKI
jgi:hypothetical protein